MYHGADWHQHNQLQFFSMETTYAVIFAHKGKINTSFGTIKGFTFICVHSQYQHNIVLLS